MYVLSSQIALGRLSKRTLAGAAGVLTTLIGLVLWREGPLANPLGIMLTWNELVSRMA